MEKVRKVLMCGEKKKINSCSVGMNNAQKSECYMVYLSIIFLQKVGSLIISI